MRVSCAVARGFQTPGPFDTGVKQNGNTLTPVSELFSDYQASGPAFDEMISDEGVRAAYSAALRQMGKLEADEVIHELLLAMQAGLSYRQVQRLVHIHPTVSELLPTLFSTLAPPMQEPTP